MNWDEYFMNIASAVALRSSCLRRQVGAIAVGACSKNIVSTGYNGTPVGVRNCNQGGCPRCASGVDSGVDLGECTCAHAEENVVALAALHGTRLDGCEVYTTVSPCLWCTKLLINAGIYRVVYNNDYPPGEAARTLFAEAKVECVPFGCSPSAIQLTFFGDDGAISLPSTSTSREPGK